MARESSDRVTMRGCLKGYIPFSIPLVSLLLLCPGEGVGQTGWFSEGPPVMLSDVCFTDAQTGFIVGADYDTTWITGWGPRRIGTILRTTDAGKTWRAQTDTAATAFHGICFLDAQTGFAVGDRGSIVRTRDGGTTWERIMAGTSWFLNAIHFPDRSFGVAVGSTADDHSLILRTTNGGSTWLVSDSTFTGALKDVFLIDSYTGIAAGANGTILRTTDGGQSWKIQPTGIPGEIEFNGIAFTDATNGIIVGNAFYLDPDPNGIMLRTSDAGATWAEQLRRKDRNFLRVDFEGGGDGTILGYCVGNECSERTYLLRSTNGGSTWSDVVGSPTEGLSAISFTDANRGIAVGETGGIYQTSDGGKTWLEIWTHDNLNDVWFSDANNGTAVGYRGTIIRTTDGGTSWGRQSSGTISFLRSVCFVDVWTGFAVGENGTILRTENGGTTWTKQPTDSLATLNGVHFTDTNHGAAVGSTLVDPSRLAAVVLRTTDGGARWTPRILDPEGAETGSVLNGVWFTDVQTGFAVGVTYKTQGSVGRMLRTTDGGETWVSQNTSNALPLNGISFTDASHGVGVGGMGGGRDGPALGNILRTTNGGENWQEISIQGLADMRAVSFWDQKHGVAVGGFHGTHITPRAQILQTEDGGSTWTIAPFRRVGLLNAISLTGGGNGTAAGDCWGRAMLVRTTTGGLTWAGDGFPSSGEIPREIYLSQNYPNPFNPLTTIEYSVAKTGHLKLAVYDLLGREIAVLVDAEQRAGTYRVQWDGRCFSSGTYLLRITGGQTQQTRKMVIVR
jgi:photosystem II stability/assembly factor-like uncharacterized protein